MQCVPAARGEHRAHAALINPLPTHPTAAPALLGALQPPCLEAEMG